MFFAGVEIMSPKKWFKKIIKLKKRKEDDKSEQAKVISFWIEKHWFNILSMSVMIVFVL